MLNYTARSGTLVIVARKVKATPDATLIIKLSAALAGRKKATKGTLIFYVGHLTAPITVRVELAGGDLKARQRIEPDEDGSIFYSFTCTATGNLTKSAIQVPDRRLLLDNEFKAWLRTEARLCVLTMLSNQIPTSRAISDFICRLIPSDESSQRDDAQIMWNRDRVLKLIPHVTQQPSSSLEIKEQRTATFDELKIQVDQQFKECEELESELEKIIISSYRDDDRIEDTSQQFLDSLQQVESEFQAARQAFENERLAYEKIVMDKKVGLTYTGLVTMYVN
jgi:hypothetical protein